jgi:hypothetical protein
VAETYAALQLSRAGASFVLKIFDVHLTGTMQLLHLLHSCYRVMRLVKPLTSRPANSEKYLLCVGFEPARLSPVTLARLRSCVAHGTIAPLRALPVPCAFLRDVVHYNLHYIARQVSYISRTLAFIRSVHIRGSVDGAGAPAATALTALTALTAVTAVTAVPAPAPAQAWPGAGSDAYACGLRRQLAQSLRWCHKYGVRSSLSSFRRYHECVVT